MNLETKSEESREKTKPVAEEKSNAEKEKKAREIETQSIFWEAQIEQKPSPR